MTQLGEPLTWKQHAGNRLTQQLLFRHLNSGRLLCVKKQTVKKAKEDGMSDASRGEEVAHRLMLGEFIEPAEINRRYETICEIEHENRFNVEFVAAENKSIAELSAGVDLSQVFVIENTILKPTANVEVGSVIKIRNLSSGMSVSTEIKGGGGLDDDAGDEEADGEDVGGIFDDEIGTEAGFMENTETNMSGTKPEIEGDETMLDMADVGERADLE
jgi:hypothetical protein